MDGDQNHAMGRPGGIQVRGGGFTRVGDIVGRTHSNTRARTADVSIFRALGRRRRERRKCGGGVYGHIREKEPRGDAVFKENIRRGGFG